MKVKWTSRAITDLQAIRIYVEKDKPLAAKKLVTRIISMVEEDLVLQPGMGRPGRKVGTKELIIPGTSYFVAYRVYKGDLQILRVLHSAMNWPA